MVIGSFFRIVICLNLGCRSLRTFATLSKKNPPIFMKTSGWSWPPCLKITFQLQFYRMVWRWPPNLLKAWKLIWKEYSPASLTKKSTSNSMMISKILRQSQPTLICIAKHLWKNLSRKTLAVDYQIVQNRASPTIWSHLFLQILTANLTWANAGNLFCLVWASSTLSSKKERNSDRLGGTSNTSSMIQI